MVQLKLLLLEGGDHFIAQVGREQVQQQVVRVDLAFVLIDLVSHRAGIRRVLEQCRDGGFTSRDTLEILLGISSFTFEATEFLHGVRARFNRIPHCLDIVQLALDPVVEVDVGVAERDASLLQSDAEVLALRVLEDQLVDVHVGVVLHIEVFVALSKFKHFSVSLDGALLRHKIL